VSQRRPVARVSVCVGACVYAATEQRH
jgi:hypothetical protein